jgi:hypothetical protein
MKTTMSFERSLALASGVFIELGFCRVSATGHSFIGFLSLAIFSIPFPIVATLNQSSSLPRAHDPGYERFAPSLGSTKIICLD